MVVMFSSWIRCPIGASPSKVKEKPDIYGKRPSKLGQVLTAFSKALLRQSPVILITVHLSPKGNNECSSPNFIGPAGMSSSRRIPPPMIMAKSASNSVLSKSARKLPELVSRHRYFAEPNSKSTAVQPITLSIPLSKSLQHSLLCFIILGSAAILLLRILILRVSKLILFFSL